MGVIRTTRANITDLPYSLHDMRVTEMCADGGELVFRFEHGFVKIAEPCVQVDGEIRFCDVDWDFCFAYVLDFCANEGGFTGRKQFLSDFVSDSRKLSFEIIDETYGCNKSRFSGWLFTDPGIKECVIEIYHLGDMEYFTTE